MISAITDQPVSGKRLLVRADLNVPMDNGRITDGTRIERFAQGMKPLLAEGAQLVVLTHFGRPRPGGQNAEFSVEKLLPALREALGTEVDFISSAFGPEAQEAADCLRNGKVLLVENLRFEAGETVNDTDFASALAQLGDCYVNDAFSVSHRAHASTEALAHMMPAFAGPLLLEELNALQSALEAPERPSVAIVSGAKVSTKIAVLKNLVQKVDHVIVGGGMANTFLFADGAPMGKSLHEADQIDTVAEIRAAAEKSGCTIHVQSDCAVAREFRAGADRQIVPADACPDDAMILDAGPDAVEAFSEVLSQAKTILWNGPLGAFEMPPFDTATNALARKAAELTQSGNTVSVAGGGDTVAALNSAGVANDFTYVSSAGGAFLEWLEGRTLPGIAALTRQSEKA
ncbi:phosphoglycerate kinase [Notoacmeibacter sp. MSK16QG-6]|uniref:phosphoglycerate kinase n=1 Tax=Notoacmeibacter sp. MSK16QG-6 TaxID=2957982 RepID=UPI0020A1D367|nr:phosphoglycerate kinase [Notoacmeibacter sp. MSK16QG-6]